MVIILIKIGYYSNNVSCTEIRQVLEKFSGSEPPQEYIFKIAAENRILNAAREG